MSRSAKGVLGWHFDGVSVPRVERIATAFGELAPEGSQVMLDVGCGDGLLATRVGGLVGARSIRGVDVKAQPNCRIPVTVYDGDTLPFADGEFDLVTISDVLHHTHDPRRVLSEVLRVTKPSGAVLVKDHFRFGPVSNAVLLAMDVIGNFAQGIIVRGTYLAPGEWVQLVAAAGGSIDVLRWPFEIHSLPWRVVTRSELQFVARVRKAAPAP